MANMNYIQDNGNLIPTGLLANLTTYWHQVQMRGGHVRGLSLRSTEWAFAKCRFLRAVLDLDPNCLKRISVGRRGGLRGNIEHSEIIANKYQDCHGSVRFVQKRSRFMQVPVHTSSQTSLKNNQKWSKMKNGCPGRTCQGGCLLNTQKPPQNHTNENRPNDP